MCVQFTSCVNGGATCRSKSFKKNWEVDPSSKKPFKFHSLYFNPFLVNILILYPLKIQEDLWFSRVFREYEMGILTINGLITALKVFKYGVFSGPYFPIFGLNIVTK